MTVPATLEVAAEAQRPWAIIMNGCTIARAKAIHVEVGRTVFTGAEFDEKALEESTLFDSFRLGETLLGHWLDFAWTACTAQCEPVTIGRSAQGFSYIRFDCFNDDYETEESLLVQVADEVPRA